MCHNNNPNLATMEMIRMAGIKGIQVKDLPIVVFFTLFNFYCIQFKHIFDFYIGSY